MAPLSLKIVQDGGAITRTILFDTTMKVSDTHNIVRERMLLDDHGKDYGLFLTSADDESSGIWLEGHRTLDYYMLRDGDSLQYLCRTRNLRVQLVDGSVKTIQIDESKCVGDIMMSICDRIGITNHEEYGLCFVEKEDKPEEEKPATGTLTLKRKQQTREKDAQLEQLSKKLKTDDNVEWLAKHKTLREIGVDSKETLLMKRRLFYTDRNVDSRDPVQLNLLYVQTRDAILDGRQVVTEQKAIEFAGIQCQVQYGDYHEEKHKPGFIENLNEFLSEQYADSRGVERKVLKEYSRHYGLTPLEAKNLYTKTARELPTYGVTFFLVKEQQKGKKKLVPRLLGINAESILRLDEVTKEILQVWPLTQVRTFRAGRETFTLDFGDYSDKEYTVKTNEAYRIRDILQGYIDIIHKSLAAPFNMIGDEGQAICEDIVESFQGQMIQNIAPMKIVEQSFVGPSKLVPFAESSQAQQGTQIVTVSQMVVTKSRPLQRRGTAGEAGVRSNSTDYLKKLNRVNANSMETVEFLTDPNNQRGEKVAKVTSLATIIEEDMNSIIEGVHQSVKNDNEDIRKKLLSELDELCASFNDLIGTSKQNDFGSPESLTASQEAAEKIVGLCTDMFCSLDPGIKRRSRILKRSHESFIADEKTEATLRRASFIAAASHACKAVDSAKGQLDTMYEGAIPEAYEVVQLELDARKKVGKLNAAIALLMSAQSDPDNLDYSAAITSMTTIDELLPELIQDAKALSSGKDEKSRLALLNRIRALCDAARNICALSGEVDKEQLQELAYKYAKASDKLLFTFGRGSVADKENEILDVARDIGDKTSMLLMKTHELNNLAQSDPRADELDKAGTRCADDSRVLLACAQLTASSIEEPHCQSAMSAAAESLTSSVHHLTTTWKPLVEEPGRRMFEHSLNDLTSDLMKALDRLRDAYADLSAEEVFDDNGTKGRDADKRKDRLKFIATLGTATNKIEDAHKELDKPMNEEIDGNRAKKLERQLAQRLALLNSAIASLICATADRENPDYKTAEQAIATVSELMPELVRDAKTVSAAKDDKTAHALLNDIRALCEATRDLCSVHEDGTMLDKNDAASKFANSSSKLCFVFTPKSDVSQQNKIIELSKDACEKASELLTHVNQLVDEEGGESGVLLDERGASLVDVVQGLLTAAQLTAPSFDDPRCQSTMLTAADDVSTASKELASIWTPLIQNPARQNLRHRLNSSNEKLEEALNNLRAACNDFAEDGAKNRDDKKRKERLKFIATVGSAANGIANAQKVLDEPMNEKIDKKRAKELQKLLADRLALLNSAIASLMFATADRENPDYNTADQAITTVSQIMPELVRDVKAVSTVKDDRAASALLNDICALCEAIQALCSVSENDGIQDKNDAASKFAKSSSKLYYVFTPKADSKKGNMIIELSKDACEKASELLTHVNQLVDEEGGEKGALLDERGASLVDVAQGLLIAAQITAPSFEDPRCQSGILMIADEVSSLNQDLASIWSPLVQNPSREMLSQQLNSSRNELEAALNNLRSACKIPAEEADTNKDGEKRKDRLKFIATVGSTADRIADAQKELDGPTRELIDMQRAKELQKLLGDRLALLNSAIASLMFATADRENPDYKTADQAIATVSELMPELIRDVKAVSSTTDDKAANALLNNIRALCDATRDLCSMNENATIQDRNDAASKFAKSSSKLYYVFTPRADPNKGNKVIELCKDACEKASDLLTHVNQLVDEEGGEKGALLDERGASLVDVVQGLLTAAQLTAPSFGDPRCQSAMKMTADEVSSLNQELASIWSPLVQNPSRETLRQHLNSSRNELEAALNDLRAACKTSEDAASSKDGEKQKDRLKFIATVESTANKIADAQKELDKPVRERIDLQKTKELQKMLAGRLALLNSAIASLMFATADRENPDYKTADQAIATVSELMPELIRDVKAVSSTTDDKAANALLNNIRALCDATRDLCSMNENATIQDRNDAASNFAKSSSKLYYVFTPRADPKKGNKIIELSKDACEKASELLTHVNQLVDEEGGEKGALLDERGASLVDVVQGLLTAAQLTAPSFGDPRCQSAMKMTADEVSSLNQELASIWSPLVQNPSRETLRQQLNSSCNELEAALNNLKAACKTSEDAASSKDGEKQKDRLKFIATVESTANKIADAQKELDKPVRERIDLQKTKELQKMLAGRLALLNSAIASLMFATADRENPDYKTADQAIATVSELMPELIRDVKAVSSTTDDKAANALLNNIRALCDATRDLCSMNENATIQDRNDAASNFAKSSSKLYYVFTPRADPKKGNKIIELSKDACEKASELLTHVNQLVDEEGGEKGALLDERGASLVDVVQGLLTAAQLTAPSFGDPRCQSAMKMTAEEVSSLNQELASIWSPLVQNPSRETLRQQLNSSCNELEAALNNLRAACKTSAEHAASSKDGEKQKDQLKFIATVGSTANKIADAQKELDKPVRERIDLQKTKELQKVLADRLALLNSAIASLMFATADRENPDYTKADQAIATVSELMPELIQDVKSVSATKDDKAAHALINDIRALCEATRDLCSVSESGDNYDRSDAAAKFARSSSKLCYVFAPKLDSSKGNMIIELSKDACEKTSELLTHVNQLVDEEGGENGALLDERGASLVDVAQGLLTAAQLTAPSFDDPQCQSTMLMTADEVSSSCQELASIWIPLVQDPSRQKLHKKLDSSQSELEAALNNLRKACMTFDANKYKAKIGLDPANNVQRMGELTKDVFNNASKMSEVVRNLANNLGEDGEHIGDCGERLLYTAQNLHSTVSEIAQSCEKPDISRVASALNTVGSCSKELGTACIPIRKDPAHKKAVDKIEHERQKLDHNLNDIKKALAVQIDDPNSEEKRLNFITTLSEAKNNVQNAEKLINKPSSVQPPVKGADLQRLLAQRLAQLNLAIASLVQSADYVNPNYVDANVAAETIAKLLPDIIRDSNALTKDDASRRDMMMKLKDLCDATKELCLEAELGQSKGASDSISKFANASNKLHYVFNPRTDVKRENEIVELCKKVQDQAYSLQSPSLVEAAQRLLTTAQITASSIEDPSCQSKLLSMADEVLSLAHRQDDTWSNLPPHQMNKLNQERSELANVLNEIKSICKDATDATLRPVKPPVPKRISSVNADQGQAVAEKLQFMKTVDDAVKSIEETKEEIIKISSEGFEVTSSEAAQVASEQLERKLALASAAASHLVFCNDPKKVNLKIPSKSTKSLSDLLPTIVKDLRKICRPDNPKSKLIIEDAVNLCDAARTFCITARDNNEKLNEVAVDYANKSAKLLYAIDIRADPNQEKEVLGRAKLIGDCASRIATGGVTVAQNLGPEDAENLCEAGSRCADAASKLIYVTKLVAPSIQYPQNQNIVLAANDQLLARVSDISSILALMQLQPEKSTHLKHLETEVQSLEKLLKEIKQDIQDSKLVKRKKVEVLEIEDTPMRQLAMEILDNFKVYVESPDLSMDERSRYAQIADKLSAAIKELDVANALCRKTPQDIGTLRRLENATQDLQHALLQSRDEQSNVVDIMDFVKEVISNIEALSETANEITQEHPGVYLESVKENCDKMAAGAIKLTRPPELGDESTLNDTLLDVEAFAQDCQKTLPLVSLEAKALPDMKTRRQLEFKAQRLTDSVNLLRFAVKSALATTNSVALDETLADLSELENKLGDLLKPIPGMKHLQTSKEDNSALERVWYSAAARLPGTHDLGPALTSYVTEQRVHTDLEDPQRKRRLEEHLRRLLLLLKTMVVNTSRCTATWRGDDNSDGVTIGEKIIQELEDYGSSDRKEGDQANQLVNNADVRRLLFPSSDLPLNEDKKELTKKLHHAKTKLNSLLGAITYSVDKPQALCRSLHATAVAAIEYDKIARALGNTEVHSQNQIQGNRIEESAKDMRFATFKLLKEAEQISREPNSIHRRRKLLDAIRSLNDSISKLNRAADSNNSEDETICSLRLQQTLLQCLRPTCTLGYSSCVEALQSQADVISNVGKGVDNHVGMKELTASTSLAADYAMHCAYLISISDKYQEMAKCGLIDVTAINKAIESIQDKCVRVICSGNAVEAKDAESELSGNVRRIQEAFAESKGKISDLSLEREMQASLEDVNKAMATFKESLHAPNLNDAARVNISTLRLLDAVAALKMICLKPEVVPTAVSLIPETKNTCDILLNNARELLGKTITLLNETNKVGDHVSAQARLHTLKTGIVQDFDTLVENITENGRRVGLLESQVEDEEQESQNKSYIANQLELATKWLKAPKAGDDAKSSGVEGVKNVIKIAKETVEGLKDLENDEMLQVIDEVEKLSEEVSSKYNKEKSRILMQRLQELRKMLDRVVVARVVEEFLEEDAPLDDLELMADDDKAHFAELKQHQLLEKTAKAVRTARLVATAANASTASSLNKVSEQVEMLAPSLVKAMDDRIRSPNHQKIIDDYKALMAQYEQTMSIVRMLCDQSIDPVEFVQTAGETMQRMCEESGAHKDPLKSAHTSNVITRLGQRVVEAGLSSRQARGDPELRRALAQAQRRLQDSTSNTLKNDWRQVIAEILQTTNEVESALSGENIFQKQLDPNQPIFAAALDLHAAVREWSAKDNEIVAVAKRMAVLMARLSDYMNHDKKREVLATSKSIVKASSEVAALARNLALECTDLRIRTNLLQLCDRIPTISGQLKMLTTVKGSSLGRQGNEEDKEAMNMLVGNAQNLMLSIQEVVSAAAAASVKIMSQRGPRMRWVRKNYYNY